MMKPGDKYKVVSSLSGAQRPPAPCEIRPHPLWCSLGSHFPFPSLLFVCFPLWLKVPLRARVFLKRSSRLQPHKTWQDNKASVQPRFPGHSHFASLGKGDHLKAILQLNTLYSPQYIFCSKIDTITKGQSKHFGNSCRLRVDLEFSNLFSNCIIVLKLGSVAFLILSPPPPFFFL